MVIKLADYEVYGIRIKSERPAVDSKESIAYDLHVGKAFRRAGDEARRETSAALVLRPNDCVRIETEESFEVPDSVFGQLCSRASLTVDGLVVANLKIDPKFTGRLTITLFNTSRRYIHVDRGTAFCSVFFHHLNGSLPEDSPVRVPPEQKLITRRRRKEVVLALLPHFATFVLSVIASLVAAYMFGWIGPSPAESQSSTSPIQGDSSVHDQSPTARSE